MKYYIKMNGFKEEKDMTLFAFLKTTLASTQNAKEVSKNENEEISLIVQVRN